ncbi:hypothetical protein FB451DRAFT_1059046 [Mycena latifolia]|nr:hypothetical protein FB451DRAFT_1059046 [Mycena latifolia]
MNAGTGNSTLPLGHPRGNVRTESDNYCSQLLRQGRGFPLYVPGPQINLPAEYRKRGVVIGDVGRVTPQGVFDFFFNIYLPADHPINANDVPEDFSPLPLYTSRDILHLDYDPGNYVSTPSVYETVHEPLFRPFPGSDFSFNCIGPRGAVLALPHGAHLEKLEHVESLRQYATKHAESWYKYANGPARGRGLVNGSLYLVTGCEKALSWGMASFQDISFQNEFQLLFKPTPEVAGGTGYAYRWHRGAPVRHQFADPPPAAGNPLNQTTFIHAFTISLGEGIWGKLFGEVKIEQLEDVSLDRSGHGFVPYGSRSSLLSWSLSFFGSGAAREHRAIPHDVILSDASPIPKVCALKYDSELWMRPLSRSSIRLK